jgi:glutaminase
MFCIAAKEGRCDEIRLMAKCGADVSSADYDGRTGLHLAASEGQVPREAGI